MITVVYSSLTGNTKRVAEAIFSSIEGDKEIIKINEVDSERLENSDKIISCYWCSRGTADPKTLEMIGSLKDKKIIAVGTLGAYEDSEHAMKMKQRVKIAVEENNIFLGEFVCRGKIAEERTERRMKLPKTDKHYLGEEGYQRHLSSRKHPTEDDLKNATETVHNILTGVLNG